MPLKNGASNSVVSSNIKTLVGDWKKDGSIGNSHPPTKKESIRQAVAIALSKADTSQAARPSKTESLTERGHKGNLPRAGKGL